MANYTQHQFNVMNELDGKTARDIVSGFQGEVAGFAVYPEYEGKYVNVMLAKQTANGDYVERWFWNTRLEIED